MAQDYDLQELRKRINTLEEQVNFLFSHLGVTFIPKSEGDDPRILGFLQKGKMIEAIQIYRELYPDIFLADAKRAVEEIKLRHGL